MGFLVRMVNFLAALILIFLFGLVSVIVFENYRRRHNNAHVEAPAIFEDPTSLKQVPCPYIFDPAENYLSMIIPAFNEEHRLPGALGGTMNYLQKRAAKDKSFSYEVLIVDDGSRDGTMRVAFDFVKKYGVDNARAILLGKNHGKGEAVRKGMVHARGELLIMLDADGATKVTDLEKLENQACLILPSNFQNNKFAKMGSLVFHEFKRQASFFFREKIKTARLALTDVTPVELLTEEATNGNMLSPNTSSMGAISRAAFEVDDYWRIVDILHKRLAKFDTKNWRASYNALVLLDHLLTHGPLRVAEEFQNDKDSIKEMENFQYIDEKRFNWGLSVRKLSEKVLMLLENESFLKEERARTRKLTMGIKGFGSFSHFSSSRNESFSSFSNYGRLNSQYYDHQNHGKDYFFEFKENFPSKEEITITEEDNYNQNKLVPGKLEFNGDQSSERNGNGDNIERGHPFCVDDQQETEESLLSAAM